MKEDGPVQATAGLTATDGSIIFHAKAQRRKDNQTKSFPTLMPPPLHVNP
jgi:hypothetical protein